MPTAESHAILAPATATNAEPPRGAVETMAAFLAKVEKQP